MKTSKSIPKYQKTPVRIMQVLQLFHQHNLPYILFKCDHIFAGQNKNLDILFETTEGYHQAAALLEQQGFVIRLSEKIEKYKTLYCGLINGTIYSIHLHREIAWHGMIALDKLPVFQKAKQVHPLITLPGLEDSILIQAAHVLFENFIVKEREKYYFSQLNNEPVNKDYIFEQISKNHWKKGFWKVIKSEQLFINTIIRLWMEKLRHEPRTMFYLLRKAVRIPFRSISLKRSGCLIALIGVNGSGKSTISKKVVEQYTPLAAHLGKGCHYYYYGWKPTFIITKLASKLLKFKDKHLFQETAMVSTKTSFKGEVLLAGQFIEFLYRYLTQVYPLLRKNEVVISDRYFYDIYGQYLYAEHSKIAKSLLVLFPKPNKTYVLDADISLLTSRSKTDKSKIGIQSIKRTVFPEDYLERQRSNYQRLANNSSSLIIDTSNPLQKNVDEIINTSWSEII